MNLCRMFDERIFQKCKKVEKKIPKVMTVWQKKDIIPDVPGLFGYIMTVASFALSVLIAVVLAPFVNFYLYTNSFPDSDDRQNIYDNLRSDAWGVVLSSVAGLVFTVFVMFTMRFGRYIALLFTLVEQIVLSTTLSLLCIWITWKYNPTTNSTILTMLPLFTTQLAAFFTLEIAAVFGQGGRVLYNFVAMGAILGAFIGVSRSVQQNYFYFGGADPLVWDVELGVAFGNSVLDTVFFVGSCALAASCLARSKAGGTFLWHLPAFALPIGLACTFSLYIELADYVPVISSTAARYTVGVLVALVANLMAFAIFHPIKRQAQFDRLRPKDVAGISPNTSAGGPIAANAVYVV